jgi:hypothetical protein
MTVAKTVARRTREVVDLSKKAVAKTKLLAAEANLVAKRVNYRLKTSKKARIAAIAGATVAAAAIGTIVVKRARKKKR